MKKDKTDITLTQENFGILVTCATRYAIGRQSYMPYLVTGIVRPLLDKLDDKTLGCLIRDIEEAPNLGDSSIDQPLWEQLLMQAKKEKHRRSEEKEREECCLNETQEYIPLRYDGSECQN